MVFVGDTTTNSDGTIVGEVPIDELFYNFNSIDGDPELHFAYIGDGEIRSNNIKVSTCTIGTNVDTIISRLLLKDYVIASKNLKNITISSSDGNFKMKYLSRVTFFIGGDTLQRINIGDVDRARYFHDSV